METEHISKSVWSEILETIQDIARLYLEFAPFAPLDFLELGVDFDYENDEERNALGLGLRG